ncbi:hypothetical protein [Tenacibaculum sp. 190524A02b]|uniref:Uncharacterized protein n=1 Tax=Tenacibaculum vairaonense TaxID=3137860 RepID=A0ABP1F988_9FLAO
MDIFSNYSNRTEKLLNYILIAFFVSKEGIDVNYKSIVDIKKQLSIDFSGDLKSKISQQFIALSLYKLKDLNDKELLEYVNSLNTQVNKYYLSSLEKGYDYIFTKMFLTYNHY